MSEQKDTRFKKGQTGNPKGYSKARREFDGDAQVSVREYARSKDKKAIDKTRMADGHSQITWSKCARLKRYWRVLRTADGAHRNQPAHSPKRWTRSSSGS